MKYTSTQNNCAVEILLLHLPKQNRFYRETAVSLQNLEQFGSCLAVKSKMLLGVEAAWLAGKFLLSETGISNNRCRATLQWSNVYRSIGSVRSSPAPAGWILTEIMLGVSLHFDYGTLVTERKKTTLCTSKIKSCWKGKRKIPSINTFRSLHSRVSHFQKTSQFISLTTPIHILQTGH